MKQQQWSEEIAASPEQVWAWIATPEKLPQWLTREGPFIHTIRVVGEMAEQARWQFTAADGQQTAWRVTTYEPGQQLRLEQETSASLPVLQWHTLSLDVIEGGTLFSWDVDWEMMLEGRLARMITSWGLGDALEEMMAVSAYNLRNLIESEKTVEDD